MKTTIETDRPLLTAGITTQFVQLSLDKLTVVGNFNYEAEFMETLQMLGDFDREYMAKFPYRYNCKTHSNCVIQIADKKAPVPRIRIEYNPTNELQSATAEELLSLMKIKRPTRCDWALDYSADLSKYLFATTRSRASCSYYSQSGTLETHYLGSKDSPDKYRIYNKALEQNRTDIILWRIEQQLRFKPADPWQLALPFHDLYVVLPRDDLPVQDQLVLDGLHRRPELWGHLSRRHKEKYRAMLKSPDQMTRLDPWPSSAWVELAQPHINYIEQQLKG